jgi:hypothetical protein
MSQNTVNSNSKFFGFEVSNAFLGSILNRETGMTIEQFKKRLKKAILRFIRKKLPKANLPPNHPKRITVLSQNPMTHHEFGMRTIMRIMTSDERLFLCYTTKMIETEMTPSQRDAHPSAERCLKVNYIHIIALYVVSDGKKIYEYMLSCQDNCPYWL